MVAAGSCDKMHGCETLAQVACRHPLVHRWVALVSKGSIANRERAGVGAGIWVRPHGGNESRVRLWPNR